MFIKLSKEEDLKTLEKLGYTIYDDVKKAKSELYDNMSLNWKEGCERFMCSTIISYIKEPNDLKRIIGKCDYMDRCTNTNAKCIIVIAFLCGEYMTIYEKRNIRAKTKEMLDCYTERKVHPSYGCILTLEDIINLIHETSDYYFGRDFYNAVQDYIASMIYNYNL